MLRTPSLRHMTFKQALVYARMLSGMTKDEIAEAASLPPANVARYFQENDHYTPSPSLIPALCRAMDNIVLADWIMAQVEEMQPAKRIDDTDELTQKVMGSTIDNGDLSRLTKDIVSDGIVTPEEAKALIGRVKANIKHLQELESGLEPLAGNIFIRPKVHAGDNP